MEGYPGNLLDELVMELNGSASVIDVGAGTGFFSIPLARKGFKITVIEPSAAMLNILKNKVYAGIESRIKFYNEEWESWHGEKADRLICVHSLYPMKDLFNSIKKIKMYCDQAIILIRSDSGPFSLAERIRRHLNLNRYSEKYVSRVITTLDELGIPYSTREIIQERISRFENLADEALYYCDHIGVEIDKVDLIKQVLVKETERHGDKYMFKNIYRDVIIKF